MYEADTNPSNGSPLTNLSTLFQMNLTQVVIGAENQVAVAVVHQAFLVLAL